MLRVPAELGTTFRITAGFSRLRGREFDASSTSTASTSGYVPTSSSSPCRLNSTPPSTTCWTWPTGSSGSSTPQESAAKPASRSISIECEAKPSDHSPTSISRGRSPPPREGSCWTDPWPRDRRGPSGSRVSCEFAAGRSGPAGPIVFSYGADLLRVLGICALPGSVRRQKPWRSFFQRGP